jgi:AcrR family transcriptional regulator
MPRRPFTSDEVEATRSKLRDAALRVFEREGYAAATMRSIARAARCSAATPYVYFESKEALLTAIRAEGFRGLAACLEAAVDASLDPVAQLRGVMRGYIRFGVERPQVYRLMFSHRQGESAHLPVVRVPRERSFAVARGLCRRLVDAGLATGDAVAQAHLLWLNCHGLVSLHLANQLDLGADFESLVDPLVEHWAGQFANGSSPVGRGSARRHSRSRTSKQARKRR